MHLAWDAKDMLVRLRLVSAGGMRTSIRYNTIACNICNCPYVRWQPLWYSAPSQVRQCQHNDSRQRHITLQAFVIRMKWLLNPTSVFLHLERRNTFSRAPKALSPRFDSGNSFEQPISMWRCRILLGFSWTTNEPSFEVAREDDKHLLKQGFRKSYKDAVPTKQLSHLLEKKPSHINQQLVNGDGCLSQ